MRFFGVFLLILTFAISGSSQNDPCGITCVYEGSISAGKEQKHEIYLSFFVGRDSIIIGSFYYRSQEAPEKYGGQINNDNSFVLAGKNFAGEPGVFKGVLTKDMSSASGQWISLAKDKSFSFKVDRVIGKSYWDIIRKNRGLYEYETLGHAIKEFDKVLSINVANQDLDALPEDLSKLTKINSINLLGNKFTKFPAVLSKLATLDEISLSSNGLREVGPEVGRLKNLKILIMNFNELRSLPKEIGELTELLYLDIGDNQLSTVPEELKYLTKLQELHIDDNRLSEAEKDRIKKLLPNCKIHF